MNKEQVEKALKEFTLEKEEELYEIKEFLENGNDSTGYINAYVIKHLDGYIGVHFKLADCYRSIELDLDPFFEHYMCHSGQGLEEFDENFRKRIAKIDGIANVLKSVKLACLGEYETQRRRFKLDVKLHEINQEEKKIADRMERGQFIEKKLEEL